jgi:hypothetical protein
MLLGKIQSGKTKMFLGAIALGFDNGFDVAIILTKGTKALAKPASPRSARALGMIWRMIGFPLGVFGLVQFQR